MSFWSITSPVYAACTLYRTIERWYAGFPMLVIGTSPATGTGEK